MESILKLPLMDGNAAPLLAISSRADVLYKLKWPLTNNTSLSNIYKWRVSLIPSILRDNAALPARRLLQFFKRCFVLLLSAVLFMALCIEPSKRITDNERYAKLYFTPTGEEMKRNVVVRLLIPKNTWKVYSILMPHIKVFYEIYEREAKNKQGTLRNNQIFPAVLTF